MLPYFIALFLGLVSPSHTNHHRQCNGGTVVVNSETDPGDPGDDTGGEGTHTPPLPPPPPPKNPE